MRLVQLCGKHSDWLPETVAFGNGRQLDVHRQVRSHRQRLLQDASNKSGAKVGRLVARLTSLLSARHAGPCLQDPGIAAQTAL
ncbi:MAG: hypothetical protein PVH05_12965 [Burkholderiales bacterium]|jgi:hypothetical protein